MRVSVIIPAVNEQPRIGAALHSSWQAGADELIVVDGGSCDATVEIARRHGAEVLVSAPSRAGQQNAGAGRATGDVLLFQHADCRLSPDALQQLRQALRDTRVLAGAFRQRIEAAGPGYRLLERGNAIRAAWLGLPYGDQGIFVRRAIFQQVGGFPPVPLMEDLILMRTLRRRAWPRLLPGPLYVSPRRWQRQGLIRQTLRNWSLLCRFALGVPPARLAEAYRRHDR